MTYLSFWAKPPIKPFLWGYKYVGKTPQMFILKMAADTLYKLSIDTQILNRDGLKNLDI